MKGKKIALLLAGATCAASFAACTNTNKKLSTLEYWKYNVLAVGEGIDESLEYAVEFDTENALAPAYKLSYSNGSYVTHLRSTTEGYEYTTKLTIDVTYQLENSTPYTYTDEVETTVKFSGATLTPLSSTKRVKSHSPTNVTPTKIAHCYNVFDYSLETTYSDGVGTTKYTNYPTAEGQTESTKTLTFHYGDSDYSYFDNEQLLLVLRAANATTTSATIESYNPFMDGIQKVKLSYATEAKSKFDYEWTVGEISENKTNEEISYRAVSVLLDDKNPGATQTAWIATTVNNGTSNTYRNLMLRLETPLSYSYGKLVYTLKKGTTLK